MILYATKLTYDRFSIEKKYASMLTDDEKMLREAAIKKIAVTRFMNGQ